MRQLVIDTLGTCSNIYISLLFSLKFWLREKIKINKRSQLLMHHHTFLTIQICSYPGVLNDESYFIINWRRVGFCISTGKGPCIRTDVVPCADTLAHAHGGSWQSEMDQHLSHQKELCNLQKRVVCGRPGWPTHLRTVRKPFRS